MISAFGPIAQRYAQRLGDLDAIICDPEFIGMAYVEAVRRRERGESFYGLVCIDDARVYFGYKHADNILGQKADFDTRRQVMDLLAAGKLLINGVRADTVWKHAPAFETVATEFLWLCDALLVRSFLEYERVGEFFAHAAMRRPLRPVERILANATVPVVERVRPERPSIVVWAPERPAVECALHLFGLMEVHGEVTCVSAGGAPPAWSSATFLEPGDPRVAEVLSRASAIVCVDLSDPSDAVAFARLGYGVVAPLSSGAHEFADDIVVWDAIDSRFLFTAVAVAIGQPASMRNEPPVPPRAPIQTGRPAFVTADSLPLVTIITPTYNRRDDLRAMLSCLAAQTYPNIESIVVNDGGVAIDDIVAEFPFARLIDKKVNAGTARAQLTGWENARGEYIGLLPDDDWLYPDHVERLVNAMLRSGAQIAHGSGLLRYIKRVEGGARVTYAFNASTFCLTLLSSDALISSAIGGHQMLFHRSVYETVGWYVLDSHISDNEMHIRTTQKYFYAFDDHVTSEFRDHSDGQGHAVDFVPSMRQVYDELHPVEDRPIVKQMRADAIAAVAARGAGDPAFPPTLKVVY